MLTIEKLRNFGCNVDEGLQRCLNNESLYLRLVSTLLGDGKIANLIEAVNHDDLQKGFEIAHSLKGSYGNLSLTPLYEKICEITEHLRIKEQMDYSPLLIEIEQLYKQFVELDK